MLPQHALCRKQFEYNSINIVIEILDEICVKIEENCFKIHFADNTKPRHKKKRICWHTEVKKGPNCCFFFLIYIYMTDISVLNI